MKKRNVFAMLAITIFSSVLGLVGCGKAECTHIWNEGVITTDATCTAKGEKTYTCVECHTTKTESIDMIGHSWNTGSVILEPTCNYEGVKKYTCTVCNAQEERPIATLPAAYTITIEGYGKHLVPVSGEYNLPNLEKVGYVFEKWVDADSNDFSATGTINADITIKPVFKILDTTTIAELVYRLGAGVDCVKIANDIVVDRPIYVVGNTTIYSETEVSIIRAPGFCGDMFVVGEDKNGNDLTLDNGIASLTLGREDGLSQLTIDGNCQNTLADVVGSAVFVLNSGSLTMNEGAAIINNKKVGNERVLAYEDYIGSNYRKAGGAAVLVVSGSFTMNGGLIENNVVNETNVGSPVDTDPTYYSSSFGGAIYNNGTFTMNGGVIRGNRANRGGAIFTLCITRINAGTIEENYAGNKGGAICMWESGLCETYIGDETADPNTVVFKDNVAVSQGGAILGYYTSPILLLGGITFDGNSSTEGVGGAISTTGHILATNIEFKNNYAFVSGGAVYQSYHGENTQAYVIEFADCTFENNSAGRGGVILVSAQEDTRHTTLKMRGCTFTNNSAEQKLVNVTDPDTGLTSTVKYYGSGGVIYSTKATNVIIDDCEFTGNTAELNGGAVYLTSSSTATITGSTFSTNKAIKYGSGICADGAVSLSVETTTFYQNGTYVSGEFSTERGGGIYGNNTAITTKNCEFDSNNAGYGAAVYISGSATYDMLDENKDNNTAFTNNFANRGGAVCVYGVAEVVYADFVDNEAAQHGGAIYLGTGAELSVSNTVFQDNTVYVLASNTDEKHYGGAIAAYSSIIAITDSSFSNNTMSNETGSLTFKHYGGAIGINSDSTLSIEDTTFSSNSANYGGAIAVYDLGTNTFTATNIVLEDNTSTNCGGGIYMNDSTVILTNISATANTSKRGGALYVSNCDNAILSGENSFESNTATDTGGAMYIVADSSLTDAGSVYKLNEAVSGAAVFIAEPAEGSTTGGTYHATGILYINNNTSSHGGAIYVSKYGETVLNSITLTDNIADGSGAGIYLGKNTVATITGIIAKGNAAKGSGGAIYTTGNLAILSGTGVSNIFGGTESGDSNSGTEGGAIRVVGSESSKVTLSITGIEAIANTSTSGGAAMYVTDGIATIDNSLFKANVAGTNGGAISFMRSDVTITSSTFENNTATKSGGAVYTTQSPSGKATVTKDCVFVDNTANENGGAIYTSGTGIHIDGDASANLGSSFTSNTANNGGAVYTNKEVKLYNSTLTENTAITSGGAIYIVVNASIEDVGSTYNKNSAPVGGAVYIAEPAEGSTTGGTYTASAVTYIENKSTSTGGAISVCSYGNIELEDVVLSKNTADGNGAGIYLGKNTVATITGIIAKGNAAKGSGGAIYTTGNLTILSGTGVSNIFGGTESGDSNSGTEGGAIRVVGSESSKVNLSITGIEAIANTSTSGGAAMYITDGIATIDNSLFKDNIAGTNGGAMSLMRADITITNTEFKSNDATKSGGAIYTTQSPSGKATVTKDCVFVDNTAKENGGAIYMTSTGIHIDGDASANLGSSFTGNTASKGGAAYTNKEVKLYGSTLIENTATTSGGAIYVKGSATIVGGTMSDNTVVEKGSYTNMGGAIAVDASTTVSVSGVIFERNVGGASGGAIAAYGSGSVATVTNCTFDSNSASNGGTFYIGGAGSITLTSVEVNNSSATSNGAVAYLTSGSASTLTVNSATIYNNCVDSKTKDAYGFVYLNNAKNVLNINKDEIVIIDTSTDEAVETLDWDTLIWNTVSATVNDLSTAA